MDESSSDHSIDDEQGVRENYRSVGTSNPQAHHENIPLSQAMDIETSGDRNGEQKKSILSLFPAFANQSDWPYAKHVEEFLDYTTWVKPKPEHVNAFYNDVCSIILSLVPD
jgi:hypothetical protein